MVPEDYFGLNDQLVLAVSHSLQAADCLEFQSCEMISYYEAYNILQ